MNFKESLNNPIFSTISIVADELNYPTYVVGGWVRDLLLKRKRKIEDIDFVCIGSGIELAKNVCTKLGNKAVLKLDQRYSSAFTTTPAKLFGGYPLAHSTLVSE